MEPGLAPPMRPGPPPPRRPRNPARTSPAPPPAEAPKPKPSKAAEAPVKPRAPKVIGGAGSARPGELSPVVKSIPANAWSIPLPASFIEPYRQPVELRLTNLGCYKGETPDGLLGPHGRAANVRWQKAQGLDGNGIVSDALAQVLIGPTPSNACR